MNDLTLVQQYLLCAVSDSGKLTNLHSERMICFLAGGLLTLELAGCVAPAEKKKVSVAAPRPEALDDLRPMYDFTAQKGPVKPEKVAEEFYLGMTSKKFDQLFNAVGERLAAQGLAEAGGPGLLGGRKSFKPAKQAVDQVVELLRAELLEDAPITEDAAALAVLLDQSGCIKTYFSPYERKSIREKRKALSQSETGKLVEDMMCFVEDLVSAMAALTVLNNI